jgi:hypothetical protein
MTATKACYPAIVKEIGTRLGESLRAVLVEVGTLKLLVAIL